MARNTNPLNKSTMTGLVRWRPALTLLGIGLCGLAFYPLFSPSISDLWSAVLGGTAFIGITILSKIPYGESDGECPALAASDIRVYRTRFIPSVQFVFFLFCFLFILFLLSRTPFAWFPSDSRFFAMAAWLIGITVGGLCAAFFYAIGNVQITVTPNGLTAKRLDQKFSCAWNDIKDISYWSSEMLHTVVVKTTKGKILIPENMPHRQELVDLIQTRMAAVHAQKVGYISPSSFPAPTTERLVLRLWPLPFCNPKAKKKS